MLSACLRTARTPHVRNCYIVATTKVEQRAKQAISSHAFGVVHVVVPIGPGACELAGRLQWRGSRRECVADLI